MRKVLNVVAGVVLCMVLVSCNEEVDTKTLIDESVISTEQEVDLGLSVKWGGYNVGATSPEQYGDYYAWGETEEKNNYTFDTYNFFVDTDGDGRKDDYANIGLNIGGTKYDVARQKWGGSWRMPTKEDIDELVSKCTWAWITYNGVSGCKVMGPNGNSIFLPAGGGRYSTSHKFDGSRGCYWSATLCGAYGGGAWELYFDNVGCGKNYGECNRIDGLLVRPVK